MGGEKGQFLYPLHNGTCMWSQAASVEDGYSIHPADTRALHPPVLCQGHVSPEGFMWQDKLHS